MSITPIVQTNNSFYVVHLRFWRQLETRRKVQIMIVLTLIIAASVAEVAFLAALYPFLAALSGSYDLLNRSWIEMLVAAVGAKGEVNMVGLFAIILCVAALVASGLKLLVVVAQTRVCFSIGADYSEKLYSAAIHRPFIVHIKGNSGEVISQVTQNTRYLISNTLVPALNLIHGIASLVFISVGLFLISPEVTLLTLSAFIAIYLAVAFGFRARIPRLALAAELGYRRSIKLLQEGMGAIRDTIIDGTQSVYVKEFARNDRVYRMAESDIQIAGAAPRPLVEGLCMVVIAAVAYYGQDSPSALGSALPALGTLALGAQRLLPAVQSIFSGWISCHAGTTALLQTLESISGSTQRTIDGGDSVGFEREIAFRSVSFGYTAGGEKTLDSVCLQIKRGEKVGVIGESGAGKSTLLDLLMGLLTPENGGIEVDGVRIEGAKVPAWQKHIAHVPQAIFLSDATVKENIAFGVEVKNIDMKRVKAAARSACIADSIEGWGEQYDATVGERGASLSGGQRQRIGIARALYKGADVIIFDEATSALDRQTELEVIDSIRNLGPNITVISVTHRPETLTYCDRVLRVTCGALKEIGVTSPSDSQ
jgi:ABC-type multidrug transport system fused ATPase/permease subunit